MCVRWVRTSAHQFIPASLPPSATLALIAVFAGTALVVFDTGAADQQSAAATAAVSAPVASSEEPDPRDERERAIAKRLQLSPMGGEISWIGTEQEKFLAIYREGQRAELHGGIIINIASGAIVDNIPAHQTLAQTAAAAGWGVLSIQQPLTNSTGAKPNDAELDSRSVARLDAAVRYMVSLGIENLVIVGAAYGAVVAMRWIIDKPSPAIRGFVGLGAWSASLDGTDIPVLDVVGTRDQKAMVQQTQRTAKFRKRTPPIEALLIDGAGPAFYGYEDLLAKRIRGWLERAAPGVSKTR